MRSKRNFLQIIAIIAVIGLLFAACGNGTTDTGEDDEPLVYKDLVNGKVVEVTISRTALSKAVLTPKTGDYYEIKYNDEVISKGRVTMASGGAATFTPSADSPGPKTAFSGTFGEDSLSLPTIPMEGGELSGVDATPNGGTATGGGGGSTGGGGSNNGGGGSNNGGGSTGHTHTYSTEWSHNATQHWHECTAGDGAKADVANHTPGEWIIDTPATETTDGSRHRECSVCGYVETEAIPATGTDHTHTYSTEWSHNATQHWHECTAGDGAKADVANHTPGEWIIDTPATETTDGSRHRECSVCGYVETEVIPATGGGGQGNIKYISYDKIGNRYTLEVLENITNRAAYTPQGGDTYTLTVEGFSGGTSTGAVTSFSNNNYTLSNNGEALSLTVSGETMTGTIDVPIKYDAGGSWKPDGSWSNDTPLLGAWGPSTTANITITAAGWTYKSGTTDGQAEITDSGTYKIWSSMQGIPHYALFIGEGDDETQYGIAYVKVTGFVDTFPTVDPNTIELVIGNDEPIELARQP